MQGAGQEGASREQGQPSARASLAPGDLHTWPLLPLVPLEPLPLKEPSPQGPQG